MTCLQQLLCLSRLLLSLVSILRFALYIKPFCFNFYNAFFHLSKFQEILNFIYESYSGKVIIFIKLQRTVGKFLRRMTFYCTRIRKTRFDAVQHMIIMYVSVSLNLFNPYDLFFLNEIVHLNFMHVKTFVQ